MNVLPRRYLDGFSAGLQARDRRLSQPEPAGLPPPTVDAGTPSADPWQVLLTCAGQDRPPRVDEREALAALGVVDLGPEGRDGCRLRMRGAPGGRLWTGQLRALAAVCQESAGGFVEIGERGGGPEMAVVGWRETVGALARLRAVGMVAGRGGRVRCGPGAGLDPEEIFNVMDLAHTLDAALGTGGPVVGLDGGAWGWTENPEDDLVLRATGNGVFQVTTTGGAERFHVPAARAASAVLALAEILRGNGGLPDGDRMREALEATLDGALPDGPEVAVVTAANRSLPRGVVVQKQPGLCALMTAGPADGLWRSRALLALAGLTEEIGAGEVRLWPGGVLVPGVAAGEAEERWRRLAEIVTLVR